MEESFEVIEDEEDEVGEEECCLYSSIPMCEVNGGHLPSNASRVFSIPPSEVS